MGELRAIQLFRFDGPARMAVNGKRTDGYAEITFGGPGNSLDVRLTWEDMDRLASMIRVAQVEHDIATGKCVTPEDAEIDLYAGPRSWSGHTEQSDPAGLGGI